MAWVVCCALLQAVGLFGHVPNDGDAKRNERGRHLRRVVGLELVIDLLCTTSAWSRASGAVVTSFASMASVRMRACVAITWLRVNSSTAAAFTTRRAEVAPWGGDAELTGAVKVRGHWSHIPPAGRLLPIAGA